MAFVAPTIIPLEAGLYHSTWIVIAGERSDAGSVELPNKTSNAAAIGTDTTLQNPGGAVPATTFVTVGGIGYVHGTLQRSKIGQEFLAQLETAVATKAAAIETLQLGNCQAEVIPLDAATGWSLDAGQGGTDTGLAALTVYLPAAPASALVRLTLRHSEIGHP
jgi:hypothetical protein